MEMEAIAQPCDHAGYRGVGVGNDPLEGSGAASQQLQCAGALECLDAIVRLQLGIDVFDVRVRRMH